MAFINFFSILNMPGSTPCSERKITSARKPAGTLDLLLDGLGRHQFKMQPISTGTEVNTSFFLTFCLLARVPFVALGTGFEFLEAALNITFLRRLLKAAGSDKKGN